MQDRRDFFEELVYRTVDRKRFTQESPVMPDVWIHYGLNPGEQQDLLMVPHWDYAPSDLSGQLKHRLAADDKAHEPNDYRLRTNEKSPSVAHNQNTVVARLYFDELVRAVLPLSSWWRWHIARIGSRKDKDRLVEALETAHDENGLVQRLVEDWGGEKTTGLQADVLWLARVAGLIAYISTPEGRSLVGKKRSEETKVRFLKQLVPDKDAAEATKKKLAEALVNLLLGIEPVYHGENYPLYNVNRNRETTQSLQDSVAAVKGDASNRVFEVKGEGVRWAVIDSGIDARHVAFRKRDSNGVPRLQPFSRPRRRRRRASSSDERFNNDTRIKATYNFIGVRELLGANPDDLHPDLVRQYPALGTDEGEGILRDFLEGYAEDEVIDWQRLEPIIQIRHSPRQYLPPVDRHGTHVAGIIGADWRMTDVDVGLTGPRADLRGICPRIELFDLRVLDSQGRGNEFAIMSAMQFVRSLNNRRADYFAIHGVNLSLSIPHDVANYACGRTPVCDEAERLVGNGIVVVTAAGNSGRARYLTPSNEYDDGFRTVSITDPGNAESVITVGSTHRRDAHTYGVSYFSSRGPTGDGRVKPDLVAPGEKIRSTVPDDGDDRLDGTSMAAPHVSGAAALIMSRHAEMIRQPHRVKEALCNAATDLGRERYFQGAGLLDILRALQSI